MTVEEKLNKAIEFIKEIDRTILPTTTINDILDDIHIYCPECGNDCEIDIGGHYSYSRYVDAKYFDELKDKVWHLLADLTD